MGACAAQVLLFVGGAQGRAHHLPEGDVLRAQELPLSVWVEFTLGVLNDSTQPGPLNLQGLVRKELEADPGRRETTPQGVPLAQRPCPPEPASGLEAELGNGGITSVTYLEVLRGVRP